MVALNRRANNIFHFLRSRKCQMIDTYFLVFVLVAIILVLTRQKCNQNCQKEQFNSSDYRLFPSFNKCLLKGYQIQEPVLGKEAKMITKKMEKKKTPKNRRTCDLWIHGAGLLSRDFESYILLPIRCFSTLPTSKLQLYFIMSWGRGLEEFRIAPCPFLHDVFSHVGGSWKGPWDWFVLGKQKQFWVIWKLLDVVTYCFFSSHISINCSRDLKFGWREDKF